MKIKKKKQVSYETEWVDSITCDICKINYKGEEWGKDSCYAVLETEVKMRTGWSYPDNGSGEEIKFDICPTCFKNKLIPALKAIGAEPTKEDWYW